MAKRRTWAIQEITPVDGRVLKRLGFHVSTEDEVRAHLEVIAGEALGVIREFSVHQNERTRIRLTETSRAGATRCWVAVEILTHYHI
jgi:hypothetical protein